MEIWREVPGFDGQYEVGDGGHVRSFKSGALRELRPGKASNGYLTVALSGKTHLVHHMVARVFIGERLKGSLVLHGDGDRTNNVLANLRYGSYSDNARDRTLHGRRKLMPSDVMRIRALHTSGVSKKILGEMFNVSRRHISNIARGAQYAGVE